MSYDQDALDAASREVHMMLLREGSSWGTKACEEMGRVFMTAYRKALSPRAEEKAIVLTPEEAAHLIQWHGQLEKFSEQSDQFNAESQHRLRAAELLRKYGPSSSACTSGPTRSDGSATVIAPAALRSRAYE